MTTKRREKDPANLQPHLKWKMCSPDRAENDVISLKLQHFQQKSHFNLQFYSNSFSSWVTAECLKPEFSSFFCTCKGFGNPLLLPLPRLVVLLGGPLVILRQSALSGAAQELGVRVAAVLSWLVRRVIQGQLPQRSFFRASPTWPDLCNGRKTACYSWTGNTSSFVTLKADSRIAQSTRAYGSHKSWAYV